MNEVKDRLVQYPRRFRMVDLGDGVIELTPEPGTVQEEGTPIDKALFDSIQTDISSLNTLKANLSSVLRVDASQNLSEEQKLIAKKNIINIKSAGLSQAGWYTVGRVRSAAVDLSLTLTTSFTNNAPSSVNVKITRTHDPISYMSITQINGYSGSQISKVRVRENGYIDFYYSVDKSNTVYYIVEYSAHTVAFDAYDIEATSATGGKELELVKGINTTDGIYINSEPVTVLPSSPSFTSGKSGTLKLPSKGWYYLKVGANAHFGLVYWDGATQTRTAGQFYTSSGSYVSQISSIWISTSGVISYYINVTQSTSETVSYCKIG